MTKLGVNPRARVPCKRSMYHGMHPFNEPCPYCPAYVAPTREQWYARGKDLDAWGALLGVRRLPDEEDEVYRARLRRAAGV